MVKILTSDVDTYYKENSVRMPKKMGDTNGIVTAIKKYLNGNNTILYIVSDPEGFEKIDMYSSLLFKSLEMSGITFENYYVLDGRSMDKAEEYVKSADLIFLSGGDTFVQNEFFKKIGLRELLKSFDGLIIGQSAGSINMAEDVFNSPEYERPAKEIYFSGLGLTDINIEPHWKDDTSYFSDNENYQRDCILKESYNRRIYALQDGSYVLINNDDVHFFGKYFIIQNGIILAGE